MPELQLDRLDATGARLVGKMKLLGLSPTRLGVVEEHGVARVRRPLEWDVDLESRSRRKKHQPQADNDHERLRKVIAVSDQYGHGHRHCHDPDSSPQKPRAPGTGQAVPSRRECDHEAGEDDQPSRKLRKDDVNADGHDDRRTHERHERSQSVRVALLGRH